MISGDFNHATLNKTLPTFTQFVSCPTRGERTLDPMYANVKDAYSSTALPPLGKSDHNLVHLLPQYTPLVHRQPPTIKTVKRWTEGAHLALQGCFEETDWKTLCEPHGEDIDGLTDCISDYINFCVDTQVPTKTICCFPNNKPWVPQDIKAILNDKKKAFRSGDREAAKRVQRLLSVRIREGKETYRKKLEQNLQQNNTREVWRGMRTITGYKSSSQETGGTVDRANELNHFFNRFQAESQIPLQFTNCSSVPPPHDSATTLTISAEQVRRELNSLPPTKAAGPDGVSPRVLKACAPQLCVVLQHIFNLSLHLERVPLGWKKSCLVPVNKTPRPRVLNDFRPVALTSHIMKAFERLILESLRPLVKPSLDPLGWFAYQPHIGVDDAIIHLLHRTYTHLDKPGGLVRIMFFDFSSAFNTIRPALLGGKLKKMQVNTPLISWIMDYLTNRPQYVRLQNCVSDTVICSTGAPQGTVLSPFLFTLYTSDFRYNSRVLQRLQHHAADVS
uniref:Reverse transcriptase domain-containing protein n=1 Tax=Anabas testudineus TaxID=64144 RepID=A0AAQ6IRP3_ANATE